MKVNHTMCISKILTYKTKNKNKKQFCKYCLKCFSSQKILIKHKENYLKINGKQIVKLKVGSIEFKNHFKQLAVPFKVYANFEGLKSSDKNNTSYTKKYQDHIPCRFAYKVVCVDSKSSKRVVL